MVLPALAIVVAVTACGCSIAARPRDGAAAVPDRTVRVARGDFGGQVAVAVGDVLRVDRPADYDEWDVAWATEVLRSLNTDDGRRRPPADGWTFAVIGRGSTDLLLTPVISRGGTPNVPKFVVTITAQ